jgi:hypothetical protein
VQALERGRTGGHEEGLEVPAEVLEDRRCEQHLVSRGVGQRHGLRDVRGEGRRLALLVLGREPVQGQGVEVRRLVLRGAPVPEPDGVFEQGDVPPAADVRRSPAGGVMVGVAVPAPRCCHEGEGVVAVAELAQEHCGDVLRAEPAVGQALEAQARGRSEQLHGVRHLAPPQLGEPAGRVGR